MAIGLAYIVSVYLVKPIHSLIINLHNSNPHHAISLGTAGIIEIDELSSAIEDMSRMVAENASTLSRIIKMSHMPIAAFEHDRTQQYVIFTRQFFPLLGMPEVDSGNITIDDFHNIMSDSRIILEETLPDGWVLRTGENSSSRSLRLTITQEWQRTLGVLVDITREVRTKRQIEHERDHDLLTNLLNRRAFHAKLDALFSVPDELGFGAMIMLDLDNLKHINDSYGHDAGDAYIQTMADVLLRLPANNKLVSRMSGDEFFVFIYGYPSKAQTRIAVREIKSCLDSTYHSLYDNETVKLRCSCGVSWYPNDSDIPDQLIRYSDFAMYTAKNSKKGDICEFNLEDYSKNSFMLNSREDLNQLIDNNLVEYHFQPIVDAVSGRIFAYEALMRPTTGNLKSPLEVLSLARSQFKLYDIERMTWFNVMKYISNSPEFISCGCKMFINSISSQILTYEDTVALVENYGQHLARVVMEFTECDQLDDNISMDKQEVIYSFGGEVALDDFGTGYNSDVALLRLSPDYIKIDRSIISGINVDQSRQVIVKNHVSYCHEHNIKVIAEGVETREEMQTLIGIGVDMMQGFYLGRPRKDIVKEIDPAVVQSIRSMAGGSSLPVD